MRTYVDTSVALHAVLPGGNRRAAAFLEATSTDGNELFSSTLLQLEMIRVLRRENLDLALARPVLDRTRLVSISDGLLRIASAIEPHVKSLDAIHLATCAALGDAVTLATHDAGMLSAAEHLNVAALDPLLESS